MLCRIFAVLLGLAICLSALVALQPLSVAAQTAARHQLEPQEPEVRSTVADAVDLDLMQATLPKPGDTIVILHTNMGDITLRFFPEEAPLAYENFVTHARNGYYDGVIFHRVIDSFMIQGGDPEGTGTGGESIWGYGFGPEFSKCLRHFRGALAMAQSAMPNSIGSQFYIVQNSELDPRFLTDFEFLLDNQDRALGIDMDGNNIYVRDLFSADKLHAYMRYGGTPHLDLVFSQAGHTVFGQVIEGMDVVDAIAAVDVDANNRPVIEVIIERVTVTVMTYEEEEE